MTRKAKLEDVLAKDSADVEAMFENTKKSSENAESNPVMKTIPWIDIKANAANFYSVDDVEDLVNSIEMHGLLDPVVVTEQDDGTYLLISGHRRHKAWGVLREKDPVRYEGIPAIVRQFASGPMAELALIMANSSARRLSSPEISQQAQRVEELLYELKEQGYSFPGRMRDQVAKACDVSASKLARLKVIRDGLSPSFEVIWLAGGLAEATAYELARAPVWVQEKIFKACGGKAPNGSSVTYVRDAMQEGTTYDGTQVAEPGCDKCNHGDAFLRHDLESYGYDHCNGKKCCLTCDNALRSWMPCQRACSVAKEKKKTMLAAQREKDEKKAAAQEKKAAKELRTKALRLVKAADASGVKDDEKVKTTWGRGISIGDLRKVANGEEPELIVSASFLDPEQSLDARAAAKLLHCSMDYLYGMTDELKPSGSFEWKAPAHEYEPPEVEAELAMTEAVSEPDTAKTGDMQFRSGKPKERTLAWCAFVIDGTEMTSIAAYWPHLDAWCFEHGARIDAECVGWYPVPDWRGVLRDEPKEG